MKWRPILFSAPMVRAILAGTKTQTRRVFKLPRGHEWDALSGGESKGWIVRDKWYPGPWHVSEFRCPCGQPGDRLWVREAHAFSVCDPEGYDWHDDPENWDVIYRADDRQPGGGWRDSEGNAIPPPWRPSIFMPRWASRITLEITAVRVERLQDISEADAQAEGARECDPVTGREVLLAGPSQRGSFVLHYRDIWEQINGPSSWEANPWVWVVEFKRLKGGAE